MERVHWLHQGQAPRTTCSFPFSPCFPCAAGGSTDVANSHGQCDRPVPLTVPQVRAGTRRLLRSARRAAPFRACLAETLQFVEDMFPWLGFEDPSARALGAGPRRDGGALGSRGGSFPEWLALLTARAPWCA